MRRPFTSLAVAAVAVLAIAAPAWAHNELEPDEAGPGTVITLELSVENERSDVGTTQVELVFPDGTPLTVVELPPVEGWTATVNGGAIGEPATGVTWTRPTASPDDDPVLPVRLGPLPDTLGRLQFKALQTYADGEVDRWIDDWPSGAPEPASPGPVLDIVEGGPGDVPATTVAPPATVASTTTDATTTTTVAAPASDDDDDDGVPIVPIVGGIIVVVAGGVWFWSRRSRP